jgi:hypothetical protein
MLRAIASAILGYVVMAAGVIGGIAALWFSLGSRFAFADNSSMASTQWSVATLLMGFLAALVGGSVATKAGGPVAQRAVRILVILLLVLGTAQWVMQFDRAPAPLPPGKTLDDLTFMEAGQYAVSPSWYNAAIVLVGAVGVAIGGHCCSRAQPEQAS